MYETLSDPFWNSESLRLKVNQRFHHERFPDLPGDSKAHHKLFGRISCKNLPGVLSQTCRPPAAEEESCVFIQQASVGLNPGSTATFSADANNKLDVKMARHVFPVLPVVPVLPVLPTVGTKRTTLSCQQVPRFTRRLRVVGVFVFFNLLPFSSFSSSRENLALCFGPWDQQLEESDASI